MDVELLERKFAKMGARLRVRAEGESVSLDIREDRYGEFYDLNAADRAVDDFIVMDVDKGLRHLLILQRDDASTGNRAGGAAKERPARYLCGHDERHWFVAAVPEIAGASNVREAMEALRPQSVEQALAKKRVKAKNKNKRRNAAFKRQGEWFFVPVDNFEPDRMLILRGEPLMRNDGGKPHLTDELVREGGRRIYVSQRFPLGLTEKKRAELFKRKPEAQKWHWQLRVENPRVLVRGRVRHADHATIVLDGWHEVHMNTENRARAKRNVTFID